MYKKIDMIDMRITWIATTSGVLNSSCQLQREEFRKITFQAQHRIGYGKKGLFWKFRTAVMQRVRGTGRESPSLGNRASDSVFS